MAEQRHRPTDALKLLARDEEDLAVISAILQDALIPVSEMAYLPEEHRFALVANRFRWEAPPGRPREKLERRLTGFSIGGVSAVRRRGAGPARAACRRACSPCASNPGTTCAAPFA